MAGLCRILAESFYFIKYHGGSPSAASLMCVKGLVLMMDSAFVNTVENVSMWSPSLHPSPDTWIKPDINVDELDHKNYKQGCPGGPKKVSTSFFEWGIFVYSIFLVRWRWRVFLRLVICCMYLRNIITCLLRIKNVKNWCNLKTTFYDL